GEAVDHRVVTLVDRGERLAVACGGPSHQVGVGEISVGRMRRVAHLRRDCAQDRKSSTDHRPLDEIQVMTDVAPILFFGPGPSLAWATQQDPAYAAIRLSMVAGACVIASAWIARLTSTSRPTMTKTEACRPMTAAVGMKVNTNSQ